MQLQEFFIGLTGFLGGLFFAKGALLQKYDDMKKISMALTDGENPYFLKSLVRQRIDYFFGSLFLMISFGILFCKQLLPNRMVGIKFEILFAIVVLACSLGLNYCYIAMRTKGIEDPLKEK